MSPIIELCECPGQQSILFTSVPLSVQIGKLWKVMYTKVTQLCFLWLVRKRKEGSPAAAVWGIKMGYRKNVARGTVDVTWQELLYVRK